jgi:hypothetical protein
LSEGVVEYGQAARCKLNTAKSRKQKAKSENTAASFTLQAEYSQRQKAESKYSPEENGHIDSFFRTFSFALCFLYFTFSFFIFHF